jgi:hypothetical protein
MILGTIILLFSTQNVHEQDEINLNLRLPIRSGSPDRTSDYLIFSALGWPQTVPVSHLIDQTLADPMIAVEHMHQYLSR